MKLDAHESGVLQVLPIYSVGAAGDVRTMVWLEVSGVDKREADLLL